MVYQYIKCKKIDKVALIEITASVDNQNRFVELADELTEICVDVAAEGESRVMILEGIREGVFWENVELEFLCAGNIGQRYSLAQPIAKMDLPVIAAIRGDAAGHGLELALACDLRIATEASHFGFPHIQKGFIPRDGGTQRLSRLVGRSKALEMILTGEMIDAQEAYRIGLVNKIVSSEDLTSVVIKMAQEMASKAPFSLKYAKEAIYKGMDLTLEQGLRLEADLYFLLHTTKDRTEGIQAFRKKRSPNFSGK